MSTYTMYLVQRGDFKERENKSGIDKIITWDYMGSAEFEWGALPKAYGYIMNSFSKYKLHVEKDMANANGVPLCIFCREDLYELVKATLDAYRKKPYGLKEFISFEREYKVPDEHPVPRYDVIRDHFWFDIEHHFMWFFGAQDRVKCFMDAVTFDAKIREERKGEDDE